MSYNIEELKSKLKESMTFDGIVHERYYHCLGVMKMALELNEVLNLGLDTEEVSVAGLLHDCAKFKSLDYSLDLLKAFNDPIDIEGLRKCPKVVHAFSGKYEVFKEYGITNINIRNAIYYHTTGKGNMSVLEKLIFISDYIDETRVEPYVVKPRELAHESLDKACALILKQMVDFITNDGKEIYPLTKEAYEYYKQYE